MIILLKKNLDEWKEDVGRDYIWMASMLHTKECPGGIGKSYLSQVVNNKCKISSDMIDQLLNLTHMKFEKLFFANGEIDTREFYGREVYLDGEFKENAQYKKEIYSQEKP